jgi:hypothetical protein
MLPTTYSDYSCREITFNTDNTPMYTNEADLENEEEVARALEKLWKCEIHKFGKLSVIDFYMIRDGRFMGYLELKSHPYKSTKYNTAVLNFRKWIALTMAQLGSGCASLFVSKFDDGIWHQHIHLVDARSIRMGGTSRRKVKSMTDIEPWLKVPIADMVKTADIPQEEFEYG